MIGTRHDALSLPYLADLHWRRLKKECNLDTCKFQGSTKTIKIDDVLEVAEFESMFSGKGTQIQPTPNNKPKSTVTIISFVRYPIGSSNSFLTLRAAEQTPSRGTIRRRTQSLERQSLVKRRRAQFR